MDKICIREITSEAEMNESVQVIRTAFSTVADEMGLTEENCPNHPSFITLEKLRGMANKGARLFGLFVGDAMAGFVVMEYEGDGNFYLKRLAVIPEFRHKGFGKLLIDHIINEARRQDGKLVSIAIVNEYHVLKHWYEKYGFKVTGKQQFEHLPFTVCFMKKTLA